MKKNKINDKKRITLPKDYKPSPNEEFMNSYQREYFRQKLMKWRHEAFRRSKSNYS